jgi:hypothetical protein
MIGIAPNEEQVLEVMGHSPTVRLFIETSSMNHEREVGLEHAFVADQDHAVGNPNLSWLWARCGRDARISRGCLGERDRRNESCPKQEGEAGAEHKGLRKSLSPDNRAPRFARDQRTAHSREQGATSYLDVLKVTVKRMWLRNFRRNSG